MGEMMAKREREGREYVWGEMLDAWEYHTESHSVTEVLKEHYGFSKKEAKKLCESAENSLRSWAKKGE